MDALPVIDVSALASGGRDRTAAAAAIRAPAAMRLLLRHRPRRAEALQPASRRSAARSSRSRSRRSSPSAWSCGGRAWRGYFPVGGELTSGKPDLKEGLYFGAELARRSPARRRRHAAARPQSLSRELPGLPRDRARLHRRDDPARTRADGGIALSLGLEASYFDDAYTRDPLVLFRIFNYPRERAGRRSELGRRRAHRLRAATILKQDDVGGLQVKSPPAGSTRRRPARSSATSATCSTG